MSGATHTPGPWSAANQAAHQDFIEVVHHQTVIGAASGVVARVTCRQSWSAQQAANARLIAAAPTMLEALRLLIKAAEEPRGGLFPDDYSREIAFALIAVEKATGSAAC